MVFSQVIDHQHPESAAGRWILNPWVEAHPVPVPHPVRPADVWTKAAEAAAPDAAKGELGAWRNLQQEMHSFARYTEAKTKDRELQGGNAWLREPEFWWLDVVGWVVGDGLWCLFVLVDG